MRKMPGAAAGRSSSRHPSGLELDSLPAEMTVLASPLANGLSQKSALLTSASQVDVKFEAALIPHSPGSAGRVNRRLHL